MKFHNCHHAIESGVKRFAATLQKDSVCLITETSLNECIFDAISFLKASLKFTAMEIRLLVNKQN